MVSDPSPICRRKAGQDPIAESITRFGLFLHTVISPLLTEIDWTGCSLETNAGRSVRVHSLQSAIETLKSRLPVVQRTEQGLPDAKTAFLQEFAQVISRAQAAVPKAVEPLFRSSRIITGTRILR